MTGPHARTAALAAPTALVLVVAVLTGAGGYVVTRVLREPEPMATLARPAVPLVAGRATVAPAAPAVPTGTPAAATAVARVLGPALAAGSLGPRVRASVVDVATGTTLLDRGAAVVAAPASTAKLLTAAAILTVHRPTDRLNTSVLSGTGSQAGTVYLRGGGDPTLTAAAAGKRGAYPGAARLGDLAAAVRRARIQVQRIVVDGSVFTGPGVSPAWAAEDVPSDYASAITGVLADGGRVAPSAPNRSATPDLDAGRALAGLLGTPRLAVSRGRTPVSGARLVGTVSSAPIVTLVRQMLLESDNVIAECLARQVALSRHGPASFTGAAQAVRSVLQGLGVDPGTALVDGSGLAARDRLSPATLTALLRVVATDRRASLRSVVSALPVAGWSGTLAARYGAGVQRTAAGDVRAKTGTLTGVSGLAGLLHDRSGRLLAFAFIADRTGSTPVAEAGLDAVAAALAACGCS
ncbi:MAG: D-alanyl-D-alanine carboxypeptidase/D-alanyl-D-alanine endopeptidase [Jatrophihabitans sp.]